MTAADGADRGVRSRARGALAGWLARARSALGAPAATEPDARGEDPQLPEKLYWSTKSSFGGILGDARVRVRMHPERPREVEVADPASGFALRLHHRPDGGVDLSMRRAPGARFEPIGAFAKRRPAERAALRRFVDQLAAGPAQAATAPVRPAPALPGLDGRPAPRLLSVGPQWTGPHHRSGWGLAMQTLRRLHRDGGVRFDGCVEETFRWHDTGRSYREPWVGVLHSAPERPDPARPQPSVERFVRHDRRWRESLPFCRGLFVLSEELAARVAPLVKAPVSVLRLPTETPATKFSMRAFAANRGPDLVQVGCWLRDPDSLYRLPVRRRRKGRLDVGFPWEASLRRRLGSGPVDRGSVEVIPYLDDDGYDALLGRSVVFLHLLGASANNTVVECIVRHTPLLVNPLPAVVEYLGPDYPLYFDDLEEAARKADDAACVESAHRYLEALPKEPFSPEGFLRSVVDSDVYRTLAPAVAEARVASSPFASREPWPGHADRPVLRLVAHPLVAPAWLRETMVETARRRGLEVQAAEAVDPASPPDVVLDPHDRLEPGSLGACRTWRCVRDPAAVVRAGLGEALSDEAAWATRPDERFGGRSYRAHLRRLDPERALCAEAERLAPLLRQLEAADRDPEACVLRHDELVGDRARSDAILERALAHLRLHESARAEALAALRRARDAAPARAEADAGPLPAAVQERLRALAAPATPRV